MFTLGGQSQSLSVAIFVKENEIVNGRLRLTIHMSLKFGNILKEVTIGGHYLVISWVEKGLRKSQADFLSFVPKIVTNYSLFSMDYTQL